MNAKETLNLISKQWCNMNDLQKLIGLGKNSTIKLKDEIRSDLESKGYLLPNKLLTMNEVDNDKDDPITNSKVRCHKNSLCKKVELKQIRIHNFRHSCASLLINNGANITIVAKYLGHTKIDKKSNTYSHLFKNQMNEIVSIIDKLN